MINGATRDAHRITGCHKAPRSDRCRPDPEGVEVNQATDTVYIIDNRGTDLSLVPTVR